MNGHRPPFMTGPPNGLMPIEPPPRFSPIAGPFNGSTTIETPPRFPPIAGPFNAPHTGVLPTVWKNFESDLNAPDISEWLPHQISNYFAQNGFGNDVCKVFMEQVLCDLYSINW